MNDSVFSSHWYRVSGLHLQLRAPLTVLRQFYRGQLWYVLQDQSSGRHFRMDAAAYQFAGRLDGQHSTQTIWDALVQERGERAPTQNDVLRLLGELNEVGLLQTDSAPEFAELFRRRDERAQKRARSFVNPLAFRIPLFDPSRLLERWQPLARFLMQPFMLFAWIGIVVLACVLALSHAAEIKAYAAAHLLEPRYLLLLWLCYPLVKALHEFGHALALKRWGGDVREMGITLFLLVPVPYVEASAASMLREKWRRVAVSCMGVMVELGLAALATLLWCNVSDGWLRLAAFTVMTIGAVSTLLVNGNPLMRFDAYYALSDAMELPNWAARARGYVAYLAQRYLLGLRSARSPAGSRSERKWLLLYALAAWVYRVVLSVAIVIWVSGHALVLAWALAAWFAYGLLLRPGAQILGFLLASPRLAQKRARALAVSGGAVAAVAVATLVLPLPLTVTAEAVQWIPDEAKVRAGSDGFVSWVMKEDGARVRRGDVLVLLENPKLYAERAELQARHEGLRIARTDALRLDAGRAQSLAEEQRKVESELEQVHARIEALQVRSATDGVLVWPHVQDVVATYVNKGAVLAHVLPAGDTTVRAALRQEDVGLLRQRSATVEVRFSESLAQVWPAQLEREVPQTSRLLPSAALGARGGGVWLTDPADEEGLRSAEPLFVVDLIVAGHRSTLVGSRAYARFELGSEPLAKRWLRAGRRLLLQHLSTSA